MFYSSPVQILAVPWWSSVHFILRGPEGDGSDRNT